MNTNLFGEEIEERELLRDKFIEPPFSVLDARRGEWQRRKQKWTNLGLKSELGRQILKSGEGSDRNIVHQTFGNMRPNQMPKESIFDPALCELMYQWFCPAGGRILDPFAGGSVRGIVANYLDFNYTGIELSEAQVAANVEQANTILAEMSKPKWIVGDSDEMIDTLDADFDFLFSCPPYFNLEVYSDDPRDLSTLDWNSFLAKYRSIIAKAVAKLKTGSYAVFVVGEIREKQDLYRCFVSETVAAFVNAGAGFYNDIVMIQPFGTAMLRANLFFTGSKKIVKVHQNVLVFRKL